MKSNQNRELQSLQFLDKGRNVILVGYAGVGKTHTTIALDITSNMKSKNVLYISVPHLITK